MTTLGPQLVYALVQEPKLITRISFFVRISKFIHIYIYIYI